MGYIYRFITPQAILVSAREKTIQEKRAQGFRGPLGAISLSTSDTIKAFLDYFDEVGEEGWIYCGTAEYPDLPYGGCYVFRKPTNIAPTPAPKKKEGIKKVEIIDEQPITEEEFAQLQKEEQHPDDLIFDVSSEKTRTVGEDLLNAPAHIANEILFRQQRILADEDPDKDSDVIDELALSDELIETNPLKDESKQIVRHQLYKQFEETNPRRKAIHQGKETKLFKEWLEKERAPYDRQHVSKV